MTKRFAPVAITAIILSACQTLPQTDPPSGMTPCATVAAEMQGQIGQPVIGTQATGPAGRRILGPNDAATMDFVAERLNLITDARGRLTRAYCG